MQALHQVSAKKWLTLAEFQDKIAKPLNMTEKQVEEFLRFHNSYRNLFPSKESEIIFPDPQFLVDVFKEVVRMWDQRDMDHLPLVQQRDLERELEAGVLSEKTLEFLWSSMAGSEERRSLIEIMMKFDLLLIKCEDHSRFIVPALLPPFDIQLQNFEPYREISDAEPLLFFVHHSPDEENKTTSDFLPSGFFPKLMVYLMQQKWKLKEKFFSAATFVSGRHDEFLFSISCHGCVVRLAAFKLEDEFGAEQNCSLSILRRQFEEAIGHILEKFPGLHCSICLCPCDIGANATLEKHDYNCLTFVGRMGTVKQGDDLPAAACLNKRCEQRKLITTNDYQCWFCVELNRQKARKDNADEKLMNKVAMKAKSYDDVHNLGIALNVPSIEIERRYNETKSFQQTAFSILNREWYGSQFPYFGPLLQGSTKYKQLAVAVKEIFKIRLDDL